jgi:hypothetical protein
MSSFEQGEESERDGYQGSEGFNILQGSDGGYSEKRWRGREGERERGREGEMGETDGGI